MNPNNCSTCHHKNDPSGEGFCYMWRNEPDYVCREHTGRKEADRLFSMLAGGVPLGELVLFMARSEIGKSQISNTEAS